MVSAAMHRRSPVFYRFLGAAVELAGKAIRVADTLRPSTVNLAGAALTCYGTALIYRPAGLILGGLFVLAMGRQMELRSPRAGNGRGG